MYIIDSIVQQEKTRNLQMQEEYKSLIAELPRGSMYIRKLNNKEYCYLRYRKDGKVYNEYVGTADKAERIQEQIEKRKHYEKMLENLQDEYRRIINMEKIK